MEIQWLQELLGWWTELPAGSLFFFSMPFAVAAAGLLSHTWRNRRHG